MDQPLYRSAATLARAYLQHFPVSAGKRQLWDNVIRRRIAYRNLQFQARTESGITLVLNTRDIIQRHIYYFGIWEPAITEYFKQNLKPGDTVANIGYHSLLASRLVGSNGKVLAIEASPSILAALQRNIVLNSATNITTIHAAVFSEAAELPIYLHDLDNLGATTVIGDVANRRHAAIEATVRAGRLQDLVAHEDLAQARLIKIDVEGAEWPVVRGMAPVLPSLSPAAEILIEVEPESLREQHTTLDEFIGTFTAAGFRPYGLNVHLADDYESRIEALLSAPAPQVGPIGDFTADRTEILFRR